MPAADDDPDRDLLDQESLLDILFGPKLTAGDGASTPSRIRNLDDTFSAAQHSDPADPDDPESN